MTRRTSRPAACGWGVAIGSLGGLIGLGGAEFRLPVLMGIFRLGVLQAIILNLVISLVTVTAALLFRSLLDDPGTWLPYLSAGLNVLAGSLLGAWLGVRVAAGIDQSLLGRLVGGLLALLGLVLIGHDWLFQPGGLDGPVILVILIGVLAGVVIGVFSSLLGVAGGELIIPTLMLLYGLDIKVAGSLSLLVSLPTLLMGLNRYHARALLMPEVVRHRPLVIWMAIGSIGGALIGAWGMRYVPSQGLHLLLGVILLISAGKLLHGHHPSRAPTR